MTSNRNISLVFTIVGIFYCLNREVKSLNYGEEINSIKGISEVVELSQKWLLSQQNDQGGWNDSFTPKAITALTLSRRQCGTNSISQLMVKQLELELALILTRHHSTLSVTAGQLAEYITALLSICADPQDFYGINLISTMKRFSIKTDLEYALVCLTLCSSGHSLSKRKIKDLTEILRHQNNSMEVRTMAYIALSCTVSDNDCFIANGHEFTKSLKKKQENGSFGDLFSTALISQALMARNDDGKEWKFSKTVEYLLHGQKEDGSFGNLMTTYYVLPVLNGHSLADIRNWNCSCAQEEINESFEMSIEAEDEKLNITFSLWEGLFEENNSTQIDFSISFGILNNATVLDVMERAQELDQNFNFSTRYYDQLGHFVTELAGKANDDENGMYWMLYVQNPQNSKPKIANTGVSQLRLRHNDHFIFWYRKVGLKFHDF